MISCPRKKTEKNYQVKTALGVWQTQSALPWGLTKYLFFPYLINLENACMRFGFWTAHFYFIYFVNLSSFLFSFILFVGWIFLETMKGLYISCPFNENFREWKLFMKAVILPTVPFHQIIEGWLNISSWNQLLIRNISANFGSFYLQ